MSTEERIAQLEDEIGELRTAQQTIATWKQLIRSLSSFSDEEKCNMFDQIHAKAFWLVRVLLESGTDPANSEGELFELAMGTLGDSVWDITEGFWR
tara:strand:+ start:1973 stop:2260 length:288 start_codon:yes stop_codon:yes gene_type:complete